MEIDAVVGAVVEVACMAGVATPAIDSMLALVRRRARAAGCYGG
jgi:2-dehydropantoate 2-reductase